MNARFKFRVWSSEQKKMYWWSDIVKKPNFIYFMFVDNRQLGRGCYIVEQCTGLKDKNGRLIYEGDIVKVFGFKDWYMLVCRFRDSSFCLDHADGRPYNFVHSVAPIEVIGNIHENPDLVEG